jgi:hypothetical protein
VFSFIKRYATLVLLLIAIEEIVFDMKKILSVLSLTILLTSCTDKHMGDWVLYKSNEKGIYGEPPKIRVLKDSIKFCPWNYISWDEYSYTLEGSKFKINEIEIDFKIEEDTLILNESIKYIKAESKRAIELYGVTNSDIKINLPKIEGAKLIEYKKPEYGTYIRYGRRHDNGEFSLQLNDKYVGIGKLRDFVIDTRDIKIGQEYRSQKHYLFCDKNTKMKDLENIFLAMNSVSERDISFVNEEEVIFNDSLAFNYKTKGLKLRMFPTDYISNYAREKLKGLNDNEEVLLFQKRTFIYYTLKNRAKEYSNVISLVKNKFFFNGDEIQKNELLGLLKDDIIKQNSIITLYDLESDYYHFLELQLAINAVYNTLREKQSLKMYNRPLSNITKDELYEVKKKIPMRFLWNYSIPHIKSMHKKRRPFLEMKIKPLDSILPKNIAY